MFSSASACALAAQGLGLAAAAAERCSHVRLAGSCRPGSEGPRTKAVIFLPFKFAVLSLTELCQTSGYLTRSLCPCTVVDTYRFLLWVLCSESALS